MPEAVDRAALARLSARIASRMGLHFPEERYDDLLRGIGSAAVDFGFEGPARFIEWLDGTELTRGHIEKLAAHLTVGETYFFRDPGVIAALEEGILPAIISERAGKDRRIRVWCAGCSSGEEPYTLAIVIKRMLAGAGGWNVRILATDINARALRKAAAGRYGKWSFRAMKEEVKEAYFKPAGANLFEIDPSIKEMVFFEYMNLAEDLYPSVVNISNAMDLIFCRNVLMYMEPGTARRVLNGLCNSLVDGGWMVMSPAEAMNVAPERLKAVSFPGAVLYRKAPAPDARETTPAAPAPARRAARPAPQRPARPAAVPQGPAPAKEARPVDVAAETAETAAGPRDGYGAAAELYASGRYMEAAEAIERVFSGRCDLAGAFLLARAYANAGRLDLSKQWCMRALVLDPMSAAAHYLFAAVRLEEGAPEEAVASLRKAIYLDPGFVLAYYLLANVMRMLGRADDAERINYGALDILSRMQNDEPLREAEGMTAGRLAEIIRAGAAGQ